MKGGCAIAAALAAFSAGCGSSEPVETSAGPPVMAEVRADRSEDRQIGLELQDYLVRYCPPPNAKLPPHLKHPVPRYFSAYKLAVLGPIFLCYSIATITVEDSRVTIRSGLENDAVGRAAGEAFCNLMQGSDVADFTPGHELQDKEGGTIEACPARSD